MEEREKRVDEKPSTYKRKGQVYLIAAVGIITLLLLINMVVNIASNGKKAKVANNQPSQPAEPQVNNDPDRFQNLLNNQRHADQQNVTPVRKSVFDRKLNNANHVDQQGGGDTPDSEGQQSVQAREKKLVSDVEARFKAQEVERALKARQTHYADTGNAVAKPFSNDLPSQGFGGKNGNAQRIAEIDQQQSALRSRIAMLQGQVDQSGSQVGQKLASAQADVEAQIRESHSAGSMNSDFGGGNLGSPDQGSASHGDFGGNSQGDSSDSQQDNVVGYAKDNLYNASTAGKIKLPTGAEINAITTYTAISDYTGGSMKAMITNDVLDASNSYVLFPKGSQLLIKVVRASGVNEVIQNRLAFLPQWLILPNGNRVDFRKTSVLDRMGTPAVQGDEVDRHILAQIMGVTAYALVGTKTSYEGSGDSNGSFAGNFGDTARQLGSSAAQKYLQIVPTIKLHAGAPIRILVEDEMFIKPWKTLYEDYVD